MSDHTASHRRIFLAIFAGMTVATVAALAQEAAEQPDGAAVFAARCQQCHGSTGRGAKLEALARRSADAIYATLTRGMMQPQATGLSKAERRAVAEFIAAQGDEPVAPVELSYCGQTLSAHRSNAAGEVWNGWSPGLRNARFQTEEAAGLTIAQVPQLQLQWAFVFPGTATAANQATIVNGRLYIGSWDGTIYSLDARSGCVHWTFNADWGVRAAVAVVGGLALFGDFQANVYAVDAATGELRWRRRVESHSQARITGAPIAYKGILYVPVSSSETGLAGDENYPCCTFRGSIVALEVATGRQRWKTYTIDRPAAELGVTRVGTKRFGPSGVAVWSSPTVDERRGLLYVGTGNSYTEPDVPATDAILALDLKTGAKRWVRSFVVSDAWNAACFSLGEKGPNCPPKEGVDFDFGAAPVLVRLADGSELLLAGQKSGMLYALDPDDEGAVRWQVRLGRGGLLGGIEWGLASDGQRAYVSISDWNLFTNEADGALHGVDLQTGERLWRTPNPPDACRERRSACSTAIAAPVTAIPGVAIVGSIDGNLRAYDASTGRVIWEFDTDVEVRGLNGAVGRGGSINAAGVTVVDGMLFQTSGYNSYGLGMPGNVLLAFSVPGKD